MKSILALFLLIGLSAVANAQNIEQRINFYDESRAADIVATQDGGFVIVGQDFDTDRGKRGALILKFNASGDLLWKSLIHQAEGSFTSFAKVVESAEGEIIVMGSSIKYNTPDPGNVTSTVVMKFAADGAEVWTKSFANPGDLLWNTATGNNIQSYIDGGVIVTMNISSLTCGGAAVLRLGPDGNLIWSKNYHSTGDARDIVVKPTGEIYFTGSIIQDGVFKAHLTQVNPANGAQIMARVYAYSGGNTYGRELLYDGENLYIAGNYNEGRLFVARLTNDGDYEAEWSIFIGDNMDIDMGAEIINDQLVLVGIAFDFAQLSIIAQVDFDGNLVEDYAFSNVDGQLGIHSIYPYGADEIAVCGTFEESFSSNSSIYFGKSDFPLQSFCSFAGFNADTESSEVLVSLPDFSESVSPIELPILMDAFDLSRMSINGYCSLTEIKEDPIQQAELRVYPNPAQDFLQIESEIVVTKIVLFDASGKMVFMQELASPSKFVQLDLNKFSAGLFIVEVTTVDGVVNYRFLKQ